MPIRGSSLLTPLPPTGKVQTETNASVATKSTGTENTGAVAFGNCSSPSSSSSSSSCGGSFSAIA